jgi:hypothetical protein
LIVHQRPSNFHAICNDFNLTVFDDNKDMVIPNLRKLSKGQNIKD